MFIVQLKINIQRVAETQMVNIQRVAETQMVNIQRDAETQMVNIQRDAETQMVNIQRVAETQMVPVRNRNIQGRYNSARHLQRRYLQLQPRRVVSIVTSSVPISLENTKTTRTRLRLYI